MDLERNLANIKIDETPWRNQHEQAAQPWGAPMQASGSNPGGWGHMSPQQMRNPWPESNNLAQNVNDPLGLGGPPHGGWGGPMGGGAADFGDAAKIWSDGPHMEHQAFQPMHNHHLPGVMNGMIADPQSDWLGGPPGQSQPVWSDPLKMQEQEGYWKGPQQQQGFMRGDPQMGGYRKQNHGMMRGGPAGPSGPMGMHMGGGGNWMGPGMPPGQYPNMGGHQGGPADWNRGGGPPRMGRGGYPGGVDMSVPPPIDMPAGMGGGMRRGPPPAWKQEHMGGGGGGNGGPAGMRPNNNYGQMGQFGMPSKQQQQASGQFPIVAAADDLMWHDPNGDLKKWQRDTGVSLWGDPEKCNERPVRLWIVGEGEEEEIESALSKCPVPPKRNEDGTTRLPFSIPSKRPIIVTGWGELPENDPNNPVKPEDMPSSSKWNDMVPSQPSDAPWYLPGQQPTPFVPDSPAWGQPPGPLHSLQGPPDNTKQAIIDQLQYAVDRGYLDMSLVTQQNLPAGVLANMTGLLSKIPLLESAETDLKILIDSVRPEGEVDGSSPLRWMNEVQKVEHNRLIIEVTTNRLEVQNLSKKITLGLAEAGLGPPPQDAGARGDAYNYSFLE